MRRSTTNTTGYTQMDRLFFTALSDVVKPRSAVDGSPREAQRIAKIPDRKGLLAEALLFSDHVVIDVQGPNVQLSLLYHILGYKSLCRLLESGVINFSFCPGYVSYFSRHIQDVSQPMAKPGLMRTTVKDVSWSDPFESALAALRDQTDLPRDERRFVSRLATRNTKDLPAQEISDEAIRLADADRTSPLGLGLGFRPDDDLFSPEFAQQKVHRYLELANHNLSYLCMVQYLTGEPWELNIWRRFTNLPEPKIARMSVAHWVEHSCGGRLRCGNISHEGSF